MLEILATTANGAFVVDSDHRIIYWSRAAQDLLGYEPQEALGHPCHQIIAGRDRSGIRVCYSNCLDMLAARSGCAIRSHDLQTRAKDGRVDWISGTSFFVPATNGDPASDRNGNVARIRNGDASKVILVHVFQDVTADREKEEVGVQILSALKRLSSLEGTMVGSSALPPLVAQRLSRREAEVLSLLCAGTSARAIADQLIISLPTARKHIQSVLSKLGVHSCLEAVTYVSNAARDRTLGQGAFSS
ncbi:MAG: PAS domain S-box protein [Chloroflexi bacterium]|nr:PAS domain S-box protein [Chloroflexota bacterium]